MKCSNCGFENTHDAKFCINCGKRIDGKVLCPKCQTYIAPDSLNCPNCGQKIPHKELTAEPSKEVVDRKKMVYRGFRKAFSIASIVIFGLAILYIGLNMIPDIVRGFFSNDPNSLAGATLNVWFNMGQLKTYASQSEIAAMWVSSIATAVTICAMMALIILFSIKGIIASVRGLKSQSYKISIMALAVVYLTMVIGKVFIRGFGFAYEVESTYVRPMSWITMTTTFSIFFLICSIILFLSMFVIELIFETDKNHYADRVLCGLMCLFMLVLLGVFQDDYIRVSYGTAESVVTGNMNSYMIALLFNASNVTFDSTQISIYALANINYLFYLLQISALVFGFVYFLIRAFSKNNCLRSYRVPVYASIFASMILSSLMLPIGCFNFYIQQSVTDRIYMGDFCLANFILMFILTGIAIASLSIYRSNVRKEKLMKLTSVEKK